ncbi:MULTISPECIES: Sec-independent protein translocase protein TatB [Bartonella]|uniref:Sec-independent protein translocase protein TatB n=1 Tax=Bartonella TaxID=773 RepID=UPI001FEEF460|nr:MULTISPECIES: Sec-independent protein translocase protein TatB [Bartonella]
MFGIDGPEFIVILIVLIVVVGPKDLPKMLKAIGKATARMRSTANEFRRQFDEAMREAELDDLQKTLSDVKDLDPRKKLTEIFDPIRDVAKDVKASIDVQENDDTSKSGASSTEDAGEEKPVNAKNGAPQGQIAGSSATSSVRIVDDEKFQSAEVPMASAGGDTVARAENASPQSSDEAEKTKQPARKATKEKIAAKSSSSTKSKAATKTNRAASSKQSASKKGVETRVADAPSRKQKSVKGAVSETKKKTTIGV